MRAGGMGGFGAAARAHDASASPRVPALLVPSHDTLEHMASSCVSPSPYRGANGGWGGGSGLGGTRPAAQPLPLNANHTTPNQLFDRQPTASRPVKRAASPAAADDAKENVGPPYQQVRVERFGWRRASLISRYNSPLLVR